MNEDGLPPLREVIARHGLAAKKSLGQNFLFDLNLTRRIARAAGAQEGGIFYEVGPGPGGLTRALLAEGADKVIAVERDARCPPALEEIAAAYPGKLEVINDDALSLDEQKTLPPGVRIEVRIVGNDGTLSGEVEHVGEDHFILGSGVSDEPYDLGWHLHLAHVIGFRRESDENENGNGNDTKDKPPASRKK